MPAHGTPAIDALRRAGVAFELIEYESPEPRGRDRDARPSYGLEAATALGVDPGRMFKTLVAVADERLVIALIPVDRELDLKRLASASGSRKATMADPAAAERATGYVVGGISPLGGRRAMSTFIDRSVEAGDLVYVSAGRRGLQLALASSDLVRATNATVADIARA
jgi:Cys-tRNA(Pro)/Cys-tRNA(Cys) deacylase